MPGFSAKFVDQKSFETVEKNGFQNNSIRALNRSVRRKMFVHLDGIAIGSTLVALLDAGVFSLFELNRMISLSTVQDHFGGNPGYLNVAFRLMVFQGWMHRRKVQDEFSYGLTQEGKVAVRLAPYYRKVVSTVPILLRLGEHFSNNCQHPQDDSYLELLRLISCARKQWELPAPVNEMEGAVRRQILDHLNGFVVGPTMVALSMAKIFDQIDPISSNLDLNQFKSCLEPLQLAFDLLSLEGWAHRSGSSVQITQAGLYAISRAYAYGVTVSYLPTFLKVQELLFGDTSSLWENDADGHELHVDREMNVWGSGLSHQTYFRKITPTIVDIFNRPLDEQPRGLIDMGCGDGTFMVYLYRVICEQTLRGQHLDEYPLELVCADYNEAARKVTRHRLEQEDVPCKVIFGDVNDPKNFAWDLRENHQIDAQDFLHVRSFLDHNRPFTEPSFGCLSCPIETTGAFSQKGEMIGSDQLLRNLVEHFQRWKNQVGSHGLLIIDLHTIPPEVAVSKRGETLATAYDATHGYTDQYPVEFEPFMVAAKMAGFMADLRHQRKFPSAQLPAVSVNLFIPCEEASFA